ncbi:hypothetical protein GGD46_002168 [Rhizobium lusitanum]|uniref:Uncharacterized protein n=1 Tax=Rhizobium lusitanum TaxID=293958 RepID=A0A7X0IQL0_9HYPH|nr:hypothetical protein [Rhizobium lusitanum]
MLLRVINGCCDRSRVILGYLFHLFYRRGLNFNLLLDALRFISCKLNRGCSYQGSGHDGSLPQPY